MSELDKINNDIKTPIPTKVCDSFGLLYCYCMQGALHFSPQELDWSSEDLDGTKAKTNEETNLLMDWNTPKPQTDIDQKMEVDKLCF